MGGRPLLRLSLALDGAAQSWNNPAAPVTVRIPYAPTAAEAADPEHIVVWYVDGAGQAVSVSNGRYDAASGTVVFSVTHFSQYAVAYVRKTFGDLGGVEWARKPIEVMASKGVIQGTGGNAFSPAAAITRAEYLTLLVRTLGLTAQVSDNFADVAPGAYYYEAVGIARALGNAAGDSGSLFRPDEPISRQDMMTLTARALEKARGFAAGGDPAALAGFADRDEVAPYALPGLAALVRDGLIRGDGNRLNPLARTTRAEAAVFLYRIYNMDTKA